MGQIQDTPVGNGFQAADCQHQDFTDRIEVQIAQTLQTVLGDFPERAAAARPVDGFVVTELLQTRLSVLGIFDDGQRYVGFQGHEPSVGIGERQHRIADEKTLVVGIQIVLFKLADFVLPVAVAAVEAAQPQAGPLFGPQGRFQGFHGDSSLHSSGGYSCNHIIPHGSNLVN